MNEEENQEIEIQQHFTKNFKIENKNYFSNLKTYPIHDLVFFKTHCCYAKVNHSRNSTFFMEYSVENKNQLEAHLFIILNKSQLNSVKVQAYDEGVTKIFSSSTTYDHLRQEIPNTDTLAAAKEILDENEDQMLIYSKLQSQTSLKVCYMTPSCVDDQGTPINIQSMLDMKDSAQLERNINLINSIEIDPEFQISFDELDETQIKATIASMSYEIKRVQRQVINICIKDNMDLETLNFGKSLKYLNSQTLKYVDQTFDLKNEFIQGLLNPIQSNELVVHWRRSTEIAAKDNLRLMDLKESKLFSYLHPNTQSFSPLIRCYNKLDDLELQSMPPKFTNNFNMKNIINVLVMLTKRPNVIRKMFSEHCSNRSGLYRLRFFKNSKLITVNIDDLIPCGFYGDPLFIKMDYSQFVNNLKDQIESNTNKKHDFNKFITQELQSHLIMKAQAKIHGSQDAISRLTISTVFQDLSGCPCEVSILKRLRHEEIQSIIKSTLSKGNVISVMTDSADNEIFDNGFIYLIESIIDKGSQNQQVKLRENKYISREDESEFRLRKSLAEPEFKQDERGLTKEDQLKLDYEISNEGKRIDEAWCVMKISTLQSIFDKIVVGNLQDYHKLNLNCRMQQVIENDFCYCLNESHQVISVLNKTFFRIEFHQYDENQQINNLSAPINDMILLLLKFESMTDITIVSRKEVTWKGEAQSSVNPVISFEEYLEEGRQILVPISSGMRSNQMAKKNDDYLKQILLKKYDQRNSIFKSISNNVQNWYDSKNKGYITSDDICEILAKLYNIDANNNRIREMYKEQKEKLFLSNSKVQTSNTNDLKDNIASYSTDGISQSEFENLLQSEYKKQPSEFCNQIKNICNNHQVLKEGFNFQINIQSEQEIVLAEYPMELWRWKLFQGPVLKEAGQRKYDFPEDLEVQYQTMSTGVRCQQVNNNGDSSLQIKMSAQGSDVINNQIEQDINTEIASGDEVFIQWYAENNYNLILEHLVDR